MGQAFSLSSKAILEKALYTYVSSAVLRKDILNLLDFIERLKNGRVQISLDMDELEKLALELTFVSACLRIYYEVRDLVQSLFHQSGDDMLVKLKDHVVPRLLENIKSSKSSRDYSESSDTMTEDQLVELFDALLEDLKHVYMKAPDIFPMSDGLIFMTLLLKNLNDLLNSNAYSVALIKEEIGLVKKDLEFIISFFGNVEQVLHTDLWIRVLDVAYEAEHAINSIPVRDHGLLQLIFLLSDTVKKIKLIKEEVPQKIPKNMDLLVVNSPSKQYEISKSSTVGLGKTTLAYKVYNDKTIVDHFDVCAWCTDDQERNVKKLLQIYFNQVIGLKERSNDDGIDDNIADKQRKQLFVKRYLIVLDDMWDTATWYELTMTFPDNKKGSRVILASRIQEVAFQSKRHSDPLYLRLLRLEESWELLEKRIFGEESCPDELLEVGEEIARKCEGLPLVLDLISGVIVRKDEKGVMKVIQLSYDHLSDHLKPYLLYLASYGKDQSIEISTLKYLWSSEGHVEPTEMKSVEEVLEVYVDELISTGKEKLFDFVSSNALSSSSSDLIPRKVTTRVDENVVLFST
uniref:Late blight resistance protein homolog R1B-17 n=1 Tax=Nicotiana tabacum TaxID=4097 RepID=A0A1S4CRK9_TOBAC|nr:PREDICTED: putative late blight resistance protein homolog R1B-17 [Nicotiana tabacum]